MTDYFCPIEESKALATGRYSKHPDFLTKRGYYFDHISGTSTWYLPYQISAGRAAEKARAHQFIPISGPRVSTTYPFSAKKKSAVASKKREDAPTPAHKRPSEYLDLSKLEKGGSEFATMPKREKQLRHTLPSTSRKRRIVEFLKKNKKALYVSQLGRPAVPAKSLWKWADTQFYNDPATGSKLRVFTNAGCFGKTLREMAKPDKLTGERLLAGWRGLDGPSDSDALPWKGFYALRMDDKEEDDDDDAPVFPAHKRELDDFEEQAKACSDVGLGC